MSPAAVPPVDPLLDATRVAAVTQAVDLVADSDGFDRLVRMAARVLDVPIAMISLVTADREVIPAAVGIPEPWASLRTTPLSHSLCAHVVQAGAPVVIPDARSDPAYRDHAAVVEVGAGSYAGYPVRCAGHTLGAFCAADLGPRRWSDGDRALLEDLAAAVSTELSLRVALHALRGSEEQLQHLTTELHEQSRTDSLTGVGNRRCFDERLTEEVARSRRSRIPLSLALVDVDSFKRINDTAGHQTGDAVLVEIAARIRAALRRTDVLTRPGGDEFAILLPDTTLDAAAHLADRVHQAVEGSPVAGLPVTVTIGTAVYSPDTEARHLYADADAALYAAKARRSAP